MLHFEQPNYFYLLLCIPVLIALFVGITLHNNQLREHFGALIGLERLAPNISRIKGPLKFGILMLAMAFLVVAMANPRMGNKTQSVKREGVDIFIAMDISRSMWAEDVKPNRMERARQFAQKLVKAVRGDRVGLILFAGHPYLQMPLTTDYAAAQLFVQTASPKLDITQGTAIESAIDMVVELGRKEEQKKQRALIVITDGENHELNAVETAKEAKTNGVTTFVVGVGTESGAPIPIKDAGYAQFQLDKDGQIVQSKMNTDLIKKIALSGGGNFYKANSNPDLIIAKLVNKMAKLEKTEFEQQEFDVYESYFQIFVAIALGLLILEFFITYRKSKWFQ
ncbi:MULTISPECIES: VWA domain-containing protein [unclassified Aureispira]|uniref:vWA domain-containing protein n=1 Tax=unclassified Aureispira TaxID=2649989 RepID=UPI000697A9A3|nr:MULTISPECIES: VWA domain-containing protein [unclassified Aureispira]WMX15335.1 VWA domain-containing protein [Aureispira sp. CCB-E]